MNEIFSRIEAVFGSEIEVPAVPTGMDPTEWHARLELAATYRMVEHFGWTSVVYNHITLRVPGTNEFLINPFGLRYDEITAGNLVRVTIDGDKAELYVYCISIHYKESAKSSKKGKTREYVGTYDIHLLNSASGWRIDKFKFNLKYSTGNLTLE